ncbi:MAG TPA: hypothetical protein VM324_11330 [Egibacteraceae bacterium]|nr:hypothetical protein [Egibacteraceae bacterium]
MIVGAAIIPTAPLLVPGVSASLPPGVGRVCDAVDAAMEALPLSDTTVLLAAAEPGPSLHGQGLYDGGTATLAGVGRPDITRAVPVHRAAVEGVTRVSQYPMYREDALPLGLSVLALLHGGGRPLVPMAVPRNAGFDALAATGAGLAEALTEAGVRAVVLAAGDLSAGLEERSPLSLVEGARDWDAQAVETVASGRLDGLARLGPAEAKRVGALGWAPMAVLHGALARGKIGLVRRHYSAPRGVGYLVAHGA